MFDEFLDPEASPPDWPAGKFGAILADFPWAFRTYNNKRGTTPHRGANDHYKTMTEAELRELPIAASAANDCALFMWVVDSHFDQAQRLGAHYGFKFKTCAFVWDKGRISMGYWTRKQTEQCWLFTRGRPTRLSAAVRQLIREPRREHSRKPDAQYERVEQLVGGPYLELFSRTNRPGWSTWGNQTGKFNSEPAPALAEFL